MTRYLNRPRTVAAALALSILCGGALAYGQASSPPPTTGGAKPATDYQPNQAVEVREGDTWSRATVAAREGRRIQVRYDDGSLEWLAADRLRVPTARGPATGPSTRAAGGAGKPDAAPPVAPEPKEQFAPGAKVEVKQLGRWSKGTVKNRDGDLYLVILDGWERQFHWQWVHASMVRTIGSSKEGPSSATGVTIANSTIPQAKAEAQKKFANIEKETASEKRNEHRSPFDPKVYDKPVFEADVSSAQEKQIVTAAVKPPALDPVDPVVARAVGKPIVLRGLEASARSSTSHLAFAGTFGMAVYVTGPAHQPTAVHMERLNLATGASDGAVEWDNMSIPSAISPSGERVLGRAPGFFPGTRNRVDLWDLAGSPLAPKHVISFEPYRTRDKNERDVDWAELLDSDHLLTCSNKGELVSWEVGPGKAKSLWRMRINGGQQIALSPGRKRIACVTQVGLALLDVTTGATLSFIDSDGLVSSIDYSDDGKYVAGVSGTILRYWDLEQGAFGGDIAIPQGVSAGSVACTKNGFVMLGSQHLLDLASKVIVWRYEGSTRAIASHAGRCWATVGKGAQTVLAPADLPDERVRQAAAAAKGAATLLLQPGAKVSLEVAIAGTDAQRKAITDAITTQLRQNHIAVADGQPVKLVARTEDGKTFDKNWEVQNFGRIGPPTHEVEKVSVTEKISRVSLEFEGKTAWEDRVVSVPTYFQRKEGQSVADAVHAANQFNLAFLQSVRIPAYVPRPTDTLGFGASTWSSTGVRD